MTFSHDIIGKAIASYFHSPSGQTVRVRIDGDEESEMPASLFFREPREMPPLEQRALELSRGRVLDAGAGAGCHSLALLGRGLEVTALELSADAVAVMKARGIEKAEHGDLFTWTGGPFDTILLLMNGIGIAGSLAGAERLLFHLRPLLAEGGQILFDSTDVLHLYADHEGVVEIDFDEPYFGEMEIEVEFDGLRSDPFRWLYLDPFALRELAARTGFRAEMVAEDEEHRYLARLRAC